MTIIVVTIIPREPFCTCSLFEGFNLAKQLFSLLAIDNLFLDRFF